MIQAHSELNVHRSIPIRIEVDLNLVSTEALLKTAYWFSKEYYCNIDTENSRLTVVLKPKGHNPASSESIRDAFLSQALDFALRERISAQTADVRDLLLAKAFSEAGVLEDAPNGVFGDVIEESKPDGMFRILNTHS